MTCIPKCLECKNLIDRKTCQCLAFPAGIPPEILDGRKDHFENIRGDHGFKFESVKDT